MTKQTLGLATPALTYCPSGRNRYFRIGASDRAIPAKGEVGGGGERKLITKVNFPPKFLTCFPSRPQQNKDHNTTKHTMGQDHPSYGVLKRGGATPFFAHTPGED